LLRAKALAMTVNGHCQWSSSPFLSLRGGRSPTKQSCHCEGTKSPRQPHTSM